MPVMPAAHAGAWPARWAASSSNPTVCRATNSRSYKRSATMTFIIPSASAASVPGRSTSTTSECAAASVSRTSMVTTNAPRRLAEARSSSPFPNEGVQQPAGVPDDLAGSVPADAEEPAAVRILLVPRDLHQPAVLDLNQHPAQGRVAIHRTHRPNYACGGAGHGDRISRDGQLQNATWARAVKTWMGPRSRLNAGG